MKDAYVTPTLSFDAVTAAAAADAGLTGAQARAALTGALGLLDRLRDEGVDKAALKRLLPAARDRVRAATGRDLLGEAVRSVPGVGPLLGDG